MSGPVTFNYTAWVTRYPEFASPGGAQPVAEPLADLYFAEAGVYVANDGTSIVPTDQLLLTYLNMITAHIASLNAAQASGVPASPLVGRISNASEGSVSVATENNYEPGSVQWYQQTKYGAAYWAATAQFRDGPRYAPGPVLGVPANQGGQLWSGFGVGLPYRRF
jgi:hypothetical protein